jgi:hypothetical protein
MRVFYPAQSERLCNESGPLHKVSGFCIAYSPLSERTQRRSLCQRFCVLRGIGSSETGAVPSGERCSGALCGDCGGSGASSSGMRSRAAASKRRFSRLASRSEASCSRSSSIRASYCSVRRCPAVSPVSVRVSTLSTRTYTRPSALFSRCSEPRSMRLRTAPSVVSSSRAASGTVTQWVSCLLSAMTGSIDTIRGLPRTCGYGGESCSVRRFRPYYNMGVGQIREGRRCE